jgi:hypothetical protein
VSIDQDIDELVKSANSELNALSDFGEHTEAFWRTFETWAQAGNALHVHNFETGNAATQSDLIALIDGYRTKFLLAFSFHHLTALFEAFLFDLLKIILVNNPLQLSQERQFKVKDGLAAADRAALILFFAEQELAEKAYRKPRDWFDFLHRLVRVACPTPDEIEAFAEMKACRDVLVHNSGLVNLVYVEKAGAKSRWKVDDRVLMTLPYFLDCWRLVKKIVNDLAVAVKAKLCPP